MGLFVCAFLNFFLSFGGEFIGHTRVQHSGGVDAATVRGFSGHWMVFYFIAFAVMSSAMHLKGFGRPKCYRCGAEEMPDAKFCSKCGRQVASNQA